MQTITITDVSGKSPITIPVEPNASREGACLDLIVEMLVHIGCPISVMISLRTDGGAAIWRVNFEGRANHYAHIVEGMNGYREGRNQLPDPTEAQKHTVAHWWAGIERPCGMDGGVGRSLFEWAFPGMSADEVSEVYLDSMRVALA